MGKKFQKHPYSSQCNQNQSVCISMSDRSLHNCVVPTEKVWIGLLVLGSACKDLESYHSVLTSKELNKLKNQQFLAPSEM